MSPLRAARRPLWGLLNELKCYPGCLYRTSVERRRKERFSYCVIPVDQRQTWTVFLRDLLIFSINLQRQFNSVDINFEFTFCILFYYVTNEFLSDFHTSSRASSTVTVTEMRFGCTLTFGTRSCPLGWSTSPPTMGPTRDWTLPSGSSTSMVTTETRRG